MRSSVRMMLALLATLLALGKSAGATSTITATTASGRSSPTVRPSTAVPMPSIPTTRSDGRRRGPGITSSTSTTTTTVTTTTTTTATTSPMGSALGGGPFGGLTTTGGSLNGGSGTLPSDGGLVGSNDSVPNLSLPFPQVLTANITGNQSNFNPFSSSLPSFLGRAAMDANPALGGLFWAAIVIAFLCLYGLIFAVIQHCCSKKHKSSVKKATKKNYRSLPSHEPLTKVQERELVPRPERMPERAAPRPQEPEPVALAPPPSHYNVMPPPPTTVQAPTAPQWGWQHLPAGPATHVAPRVVSRVVHPAVYSSIAAPPKPLAPVMSHVSSASTQNMTPPPHRLASTPPAGASFVMAAPQWQANTSGAQTHTASCQECGNVFVEDESFCRKCGKPRSVASSSNSPMQASRASGIVPSLPLASACGWNG